MRAVLARITGRLKEPSTYAGLAAVALVAGMQMDKFQMYANAAAGLFGFISMLAKDPGSSK